MQNNRGATNMKYADNYYDDVNRLPLKIGISDFQGSQNRFLDRDTRKFDPKMKSQVKAYHNTIQ